MPSCSNLCLAILFQPGLFFAIVLVNCSRFVYSVLHVLLVYWYSTSTIWQIVTPFHHGQLDQIALTYSTWTKAKLLVIMLNRSRFVYSVFHTLLSLFVFNLDNLTTCSLCQFDNKSYATLSLCWIVRGLFIPFYKRCLVYLRLAWTIWQLLRPFDRFCIFGGDGRPYDSVHSSHLWKLWSMTMSWCPREARSPLLEDKTH